MGHLFWNFLNFPSFRALLEIRGSRSLRHLRRWNRSSRRKTRRILDARPGFFWGSKRRLGDLPLAILNWELPLPLMFRIQDAVLPRSLLWMSTTWLPESASWRSGGGCFLFDFDFVSFGTERHTSDISDIRVASLCLSVQGLIRQTSMNKMARRKESNLWRCILQEIRNQQKNTWCYGAASVVFHVFFFGSIFADGTYPTKDRRHFFLPSNWEVNHNVTASDLKPGKNPCGEVRGENSRGFQHGNLRVTGTQWWLIHPGRLTWNLLINHLERKMNFQASMIMFQLLIFQGVVLL